MAREQRELGQSVSVYCHHENARVGVALVDVGAYVLLPGQSHRLVELLGRYWAVQVRVRCIMSTISLAL